MSALSPLVAVKLATLTAVAATPQAPQWLGPHVQPAQVKRIVSLAPSLTEMLFAIGAGDAVVGVTRFDDYPAAVHSLPKVGGFIDPDPEAVLALHPDLVVAVPTSGGRRIVDTLVRLETPVLVLPAARVGDMWVALEALGKAVGRASAAAQLVSRLQAERRSLAQRYHTNKPLRVVVVLGTRPWVVAGPGSFLDGLLPDIGATNAIRRGGPFPVLDLEAILAAKADLLVDLSRDHNPEPARVWTDLRHLGAGRIIHVASETLLRPGPRLFTGLRALAHEIHPDAATADAAACK